MHQMRFESPDIEPSLRQDSRAWLVANGCLRAGARPWPAEGDLPRITDCRGASPDDREQLFGPEFRNLLVLSAEPMTGVGLLLEVVIAGEPVVLVGDPRAALSVYLGGHAGKAETAH